MLRATEERPSRTWQEELHDAISLSREAEDRLDVGPAAVADISRARERFPILVPPSYAALVDWADPGDPLRRLLLPTRDEEQQDGEWDTSGESESVVVRGLQHKYEQTAVLLVTQACAGHCRYCFRRRLLSRDVFTRETIEDLDEALHYVAANPGIDNVLLSGGDPMVCSTPRLRRILEACASIPHIAHVRIGTKLPAFLPSRFTGDADLLEMLTRLGCRTQILFQCHFDHPREITAETELAIRNLLAAGCVLTAQVALMRGINDDAEVLAALFKKLHRLGVVPQYLFHPRPVRHGTHFQLSIEEGLRLVEQVRRSCSGPVKRFRYVLAQEDGKLELVGAIGSGDARQLVVRWHQIRRGLARPAVETLPLPADKTWITRADFVD